ncbi:MAG: hypothetical protein ACKVQK_00830 [Burkholderiales bacterium]
MTKQFKNNLGALLLGGLYLIGSAATAQVYQWKDAESGATRFANSAPSWYRNAYGESRAPRVQVFYYGVLVDDTSLPYDSRISLRSRTHIGRYLPTLIPPTSMQARR